ncbi:hypothetical protein HW555_013943 [Spodoptera exigua]|uniref:Uncharacterized protein n=1 Tax=Spodoptera exigua TaxID=7107 RepID=A0A835KZC0_SPOEX|nr:hypothetical protein HW555_013943 [Spodoptera exigua]
MSNMSMSSEALDNSLYLLVIRAMGECLPRNMRSRTVRRDSNGVSLKWLILSSCAALNYEVLENQEGGSLDSLNHL